MGILCAGCGKAISFQDALCPGCGRFVLADLPAQQVHQREVSRGPGVTIALSTFFGIFGGFFLIVFLLTSGQGRSERPYHATNDLQAVQPVAEKWVIDHPGQCPTMRQLRDDKEISPGSKITDPWGSEYHIECVGDEVSVRSFGPDRLADTADDVTIPSKTDRSDP